MGEGIGQDGDMREKTDKKRTEKEKDKPHVSSLHLSWAWCCALHM